MTAGRTLAVMPKSTSQTSPRRTFGIFGLGLVVGLERGVGGSNQIRLGLDAMSVVVNNPAAALTELAVNGLLDFHEFFGSQIWQHGFDFGNRAHGGKDSRECMKRQRRLCRLRISPRQAACGISFQRLECRRESDFLSGISNESASTAVCAPKHLVSWSRTIIRILL